MNAIVTRMDAKADDGWAVVVGDDERVVGLVFGPTLRVDASWLCVSRAVSRTAHFEAPRA